MKGEEWTLYQDEMGVVQEVKVEVNGQVDGEVEVYARNIVQGLAKALNTAHIPLESVIKAEIKGARQ